MRGRDAEGCACVGFRAFLLILRCRKERRMPFSSQENGPKSNRFGWASYLGKADPQVAVPARHEDLSGLASAIRVSASGEHSERVQQAARRGKGRTP